MRGLIDRHGHRQRTARGLEQTVAVSRAAWLSDDIVLFTCSAPTAASHMPVAGLRIEGRLLALPRSAHGDRTPPFTVCAAQGLGPRPPSGVIVVDTGERVFDMSGRELLDSITDLATLLREQLAGLDADSRARLVAFLSALPLSFGATAALTAGLRAAREALRERQPLSIHDRHADLAIGVDAVYRVDRMRFYVQGWVVDRSVPMLQLTALTPEGERVDLSECAVRYPRPDIAQKTDDPTRVGFACTFETRTPSDGDGWVFTVCDARERCVETPELVVVDEGETAATAIAAAAGWDFGERQTLLTQHVEPALTRLQAALRDRVGIASLDRLGSAPEDPAISIVLSLDGDGELLEHQLAQVAADTTLRACELICVQDGSRDVERCRWRADQLFDLYGVPFSLAVLTGRGGVALGRVAGASVAAGPRLLFLDAGVLGTTPGWLAPLARFHAAIPDAGAVTGKLIGADGAIRHAGFAFERQLASLEWESTERFAGLHQSLPAANITRPVPAVSGACTLVDSARYAAAAAEAWRFVAGGYADRDACLRLGEAGHESWYVPRATLLHLSLDGGPTIGQAYNRWLLHHLWHDRFGATA